MARFLRRFGLPAAIVAAAVGAVMPIVGTREDVVRIARHELGSDDWPKYCADALGVEQVTDRYEWCGMFTLWALHQAGLAHDIHWKVGLGYLYRLPQVPRGQLPKPGDMAYFDRPFQHHAIVEWVDPERGLVSTLNGNGGGGKVTRVVRPITDATDYYSIEPLLWVGE